MKVVHWRLTAGHESGQETRDMKRQLGEAYIERLRTEEGEDVYKVKELSDRLTLFIKETGDPEPEDRDPQYPQLDA